MEIQCQLVEARATNINEEGNWMTASYKRQWKKAVFQEWWKVACLDGRNKFSSILVHFLQRGVENEPNKYQKIIFYTDRLNIKQQNCTYIYMHSCE